MNDHSDEQLCRWAFVQISSHEANSQTIKPITGTKIAQAICVLYPISLYATGWSRELRSKILKLRIPWNPVCNRICASASLKSLTVSLPAPYSCLLGKENPVSGKLTDKRLIDCHTDIHRKRGPQVRANSGSRLHYQAVGNFLKWKLTSLFLFYFTKLIFVFRFFSHWVICQTGHVQHRRQWHQPLVFITFFDWETKEKKHHR